MRAIRPASHRIACLLSLMLAIALPLTARNADSSRDLEQAKQLFQRNLDAIRHKDRDAYLACYLESDKLARTGPTGFELGIEGLRKSTGSAWPDRFEGLDLHLVPVKPGVVYGTYRYRVRYGAREESGISERLFLETPKGWRIAVSTAFPALPGVPPPPQALVGATLLDAVSGSAVPDSVVVLRSGKIDCAGTRARCSVPAGLTVLDLHGAWITPGLVDAHVHFSQTGWADGRPDFIDVRSTHPYEGVIARLKERPEPFFRSYLCSGVTAVFDVGGYSWTWDLRARSEADPLAPHVAAAGPLLSTTDFWLNLPGDKQLVYLSDVDAAQAGVRYLAARGTDAVKVWFIVDPKRDFDEMAHLVSAAGAEAKRLNVPLIVHATGLREAKAALAAGANLLVHGVGDLEVDDAFLQKAKSQGTIYCPTLTVFDGYRRAAAARAEKKAPEVDDPGGCVDPETLDKVRSTASLDAAGFDAARLTAFTERVRKELSVGSANLKKVRDAGIPIAMGTDAGNPLTLHGASVFAEMEAMQAAGLSPMEVLVAATRGGALAMGKLDRWGTVEAGKEADLVVLDADPSQDIRNFRKIRYVVKGGVVRTRDELRPAPSGS